IAGSFASRNENLWIHAKLKLCLLVIQQPPFQAEEDIVRSDRVATSVLFENFDQEFEFQLRLRQSVIQIEQKRIHLCCISRVELAPGIGHETWAGLRQINTTHQPITRSEEHTSELQSLRHLVCRLLLEKKKIRAIMTYV